MLISVIRAVPPQAVACVKAHEGCRLTVYADSVGALTVGYGHTSPGLQMGQTITQDQADTYLAQDLGTAAHRLEAQVGSDVVSALTDNQYAALLSFVFNLGAGPAPNAPKEWTIWKLLRAKQFVSAADEIPRFDKAGGRVLLGLTRRRSDEKVLYMTGAPQTVDESPPSSTTRSIPTPPTEAVVTPLSKANHWIAGCVATCVTGASAIAPTIKGGLDQAQDAITPYVGHSTVLAGISDHLALAAAAVSALALLLTWMSHQKAKVS